MGDLDRRLPVQQGTWRTARGPGGDAESQGGGHGRDTQWSSSAGTDKIASLAARREHCRKENLQMCGSICIFIVYLVVFSLAMLLEQSATSSRFTTHIKEMFTSGTMPLKDVETHADFYQFLIETLVPALYQNNTDTNLAMEYSRFLHPIDSSNRMMGPARVRQVRVEYKDNCEVSPMFSNYQVSCYPKFSGGTESTASFGPGEKFRWSTDPDGTGYSGSYATYGADGFMQYLSINRTAAVQTIGMLQTDGFLSYSTRAVFIDFTIWNSNVGKYAVTRICVEYGAGGTTDTFLEVNILSEETLVPGFSLLPVIIVMMFVLWYMVEEAQEIYHARLSYLWDAWNVLDWINMLLLLVAFIIRCLVFARASAADIGEQQLQNPDIFPVEMRNIATMAEMVKRLHAFNAVLLWAKCAKYLIHLPIVKEIIRTVWDAFNLFLPFLCMFMIAFVGFTIAYNIGFGDKIEDLATFFRAFIYLSRALLLDVKMMPVYHITPLFGAAMILLFYVMLVLVGANVLFAIIADALGGYQVRRKKGGDPGLHEDEPLEEFYREVRLRLHRALSRNCPWSILRILHFFFGMQVAEEEVTGSQQQSHMASVGVSGGSQQRASMLGLPQPGDDGQELRSLAQAALEDQLELPPDARGGYDEDEEGRPGSGTSATPPRILSSEDVMLAIQHMSGRVLSEVQEVGIEITSELHDVCERVAQMQMAVEELAWRAELVQREQEEALI